MIMKKNKRTTAGNKKKIVISAVLVSIVFLIGFQLVKGSGPEKYQLFSVKNADPLALQGKVAPREQKEYYFEPALGKIEELFVQNTQEVQKDAPLFRYHNAETETQLSMQSGQVKAAEVTYNQAVNTVTLEQNKVNDLANKVANSQAKINQAEDEETRLSLDATKASLQAELDNEKSALEQAKQAVETAAVQMENANQLLTIEQGKETTVVTAGIDGVVSVNTAGMANSEAPVVQIFSKDKLIKATVTEYDVDKLAVDQDVHLLALGEKQPVNGKITAINPAAKLDKSDNTVSSYEFTISGDINWRNDLSVTVQVPQDYIVIPDSAIVKEKETDYVYVYKQGKVKKTKITLAEKNGRRIVTEGLKVGDKIIENPSEKMDESQKIEVIDSDSIN